MLAELEAAIEKLAQEPVRSDASLRCLSELRAALNSGHARVVSFEAGEPRLTIWVKRGILLHALLGGLSEVVGSRGGFWELDTFPPRHFSSSDAVRIAPGAMVRDGVHIGPGSMVLPGSNIAIGAYLGSQCQIDAGCSIGLCATLGNGVFLEAGSRIGGVLNPAERFPVVLGDVCILAIGAAVMGSVQLGRNSLVAPGVHLTDAAPIWNNVSEEWIHPQPGGRLVLPEGAILINGIAPAARAMFVTPIVAGIAEKDEPASAAYRRVMAKIGAAHAS